MAVSSTPCCSGAEESPQSFFDEPRLSTTAGAAPREGCIPDTHSPPFAASRSEARQLSAARDHDYPPSHRNRRRSRRPTTRELAWAYLRSYITPPYGAVQHYLSPASAPPTTWHSPGSRLRARGKPKSATLCATSATPPSKPTPISATPPSKTRANKRNTL